MPVNQNMTTETGVITGRLRRRSSANSAIITAGSTATCSQYARAMITCPGKSPPKIHNIRCVPMTGIDSVTPSSTPRLPPDNRSSGRMVPDTPATMPSTSKLTQISQFSQRGLRNPPVKYSRSRCAHTAAMNSSAAQW